jgi:hypothetical protein
MDKSKLYDSEGKCVMCLGEKEDHQEDCPGQVIENLVLEVNYRGPNCSRGCCGTTQGTVNVLSIPEAVERISLCVDDVIRLTCYARYVYELPSHGLGEQALELRNKRHTAETAKSNAEAEEWARAEQLAALERLRPDLTPEAYARRKQELEA